MPVKRSIDDLEERHEISPKRTKMTDLNSVNFSEGKLLCYFYLGGEGCVVHLNYW